MSQKKLHLGAFMRPVSIHTAWWRYPGAAPDANFNFAHLASFAQTLERGKFDAFFMADHLAVLNMPMAALKRSATVTSFDPLILLPALAAMTSKIGLIATGSTTFDTPYNLARKFASLDALSGGRAGWNIVTTSNPDAALNFGLDDHMEHDERYARAAEFYQVVTGLWDSFADDAFVRDVDSGIFFDPAKMRALNHVGKYFKVKGPLNVARPPQGWPVIVQAGASQAGRNFAAGTAEMIFAEGGLIEKARAFYADMKTRAENHGRNPAHMKILPGALVVVGNTQEEAREKRALLDSLVHPDSGLGTLSTMLGVDARQFALDEKLPETLPPTNASHSARERVLEMAARENWTVRQLAQYVGGFAGASFTGTPASIADEMAEWFHTGACDGFNVMFPTVPAGLDDFVNLVVPELQRRGLFRTEYEGSTLREHLGLPRPANRFF